MFRLDYLLTQTDSNSEFQLLKNQLLTVDSNGFITSVKPYQNEVVDDHIQNLVMPSFANAHSHGFQIGMRGVADNPRNFADWVNRYLYPSVEKITAESFRILMRKLYREMLSFGITALGEFHYFHHNDSDRKFEFDLIVLEEAKAAGIRLSLLQSAYDLGNRDAQKRFHANATEFEQSLQTCENWIQNEQLSDTWSLSVAPHSLHGCSAPLLEAAVDWAVKRRKFWHIHLAEQQHDLPHAQKQFGTSPLLALRDILGTNLTNLACLVHAVWLNNEEIDLFNNLGLNLIYNPITNMYLGDGITKTVQFNLPHSKVALGTDSNNAFNMLNEVKMMECLQRVSSLDMGVINSHHLLASITSFSGELLNLKTGILHEGYLADMIEIKLSDKLQCNLDDLSVDDMLNHLIFSGVDRADLGRTIIGGECALATI